MNTTHVHPYVQRASYLIGIVLASVAFEAVAVIVVGLLAWLARAVWSAALG